MTERTYWRADDLRVEDEPLAMSLIKYRQKKNRHQVPKEDANLISSLDTDGKHRPILDLDFDHTYVPSSSDGHAHLYLNLPMSRAKLFGLVLVLWWCGVIEMGHAVWTIRRGASFVRTPWAHKTEAENTYPTYGWFFKRKS